jgi:hypothetical protein
MGWVRMNASWDSERRHRRVGVFGRMALRAAILLSKERDWQRQERRGWVPRAEFDAEEIARHLELLGDEDLARFMTREQLVEALAAGVGRCEVEGLLQTEGDGWWIDGWEAYVPDPTATARKRAQRERDREAQVLVEGVTGGHRDEPGTGAQPGHGDKRDGDDPGGGGVTGGHRDKPEGSPNGAAASRAQAGHGDERDVTPRDGTRRDVTEVEDTLPTPRAAGGGGNSPSALTAGEERVADVLIEALERGWLRLESPEDADRRRRAAPHVSTDTKAKAVWDELVRAERARRDEALAALRSHGPEARPVINRWQNSEALFGGEGKDRISIRRVCNIARRNARADERDRRRGGMDRPLPFVAPPALVEREEPRRRSASA